MFKTLFAAFALFFISLPAHAVPNCSSSFCVGNGNGSQCTLGGQVHTCGRCMGSTNVLYVGDLSPAQAEDRCRCQHDPAYSCSIRRGEIRTATPVAPDKGTVAPTPTSTAPTPTPTPTLAPQQKTTPCQ